jgi:RecA-family ATPase
MALKMMEDNPFAKHIGIKEWTTREIIAPKAEEYTIAEIIPANSLVCLKTNGIYGKSTLAMQAAMSVALGLSFLGKYKCQEGHVIYLSGQDTDDDNCRRFKRLCREWQKTEPEFDYKLKQNGDNLTCISMCDDCYGTQSHLVDITGSHSRTLTHLLKFCEYYKVKLVVLDPIEEFFPENIKNITEFYRTLRQLNTSILMLSNGTGTSDVFHGVEVGIQLSDDKLQLKNFFAGKKDIQLKMGVGIWTTAAL